jgi:hypothetical protein
MLKKHRAMWSSGDQVIEIQDQTQRKGIFAAQIARWL